MTPDDATIFSVELCVILTLAAALLSQVRQHTRVFSSLVLFALGWAVLYPYYASISNIDATTPQLQLLPALQGILLALAGGPLRRQSAVEGNSQADQGIGKWDFFLVTILLGFAIALPMKASHVQVLGHSFIVYARIIDIFAYASIVHGAFKLVKGDSRNVSYIWIAALFALLVIAGFYCFYQAEWTTLLWQGKTQMPPEIKWAFSVLKVLFSVVFLGIVVMKVQLGDKSIFIAHCTVDKELTTKLLELLTPSLNLQANEIRCTTVEPGKLEANDSIDYKLRRDVESAKVLIGLVTPNSLKSTYFMYEIAFRHGTGRPMALVLAGVRATAVGYPFAGRQMLDGGDETGLRAVIEYISKQLGRKVEPAPDELIELAELVQQYQREHELGCQQAAP